jgi:hypothetical protein
MRARTTGAVGAVAASGVPAVLGRAGAGPASAAAGAPPRPAAVYVTNSGAGTVTPIRVATNQPGRAIKIGGTVLSIAITP